MPSVRPMPNPRLMDPTPDPIDEMPTATNRHATVIPKISQVSQSSTRSEISMTLSPAEPPVPETLTTVLPVSLC